MPVHSCIVICMVDGTLQLQVSVLVPRGVESKEVQHALSKKLVVSSLPRAVMALIAHSLMRSSCFDVSLTFIYCTPCPDA